MKAMHAVDDVLTLLCHSFYEMLFNLIILDTTFLFAAYVSFNKIIYSFSKVKFLCMSLRHMGDWKIVAFSCNLAVALCVFEWSTPCPQCFMSGDGAPITTTEYEAVQY
jgi:hypothetical protein